MRGKAHACFLPTGETALFLLAGDDLSCRLTYQAHLWADSPLATVRLVQLTPTEAGKPTLSGLLMVPFEVLALLLTGERPRSHLSSDFSAQRVSAPALK